MDNNSSKLTPSDEGFQYSLVPGKEVEILAPVEKAFTSTFFLLEVRNWESENRSYKLKIENSPDRDRIGDSLNWMTSTLHITFKLPPDYQGGPVAFLQRLNQLFNGNYPLGIACVVEGNEAIEELRSHQPSSTGKVLAWSKHLKRVAGCASRRITVHQTGMILFKITPTDDIPVGILVSTEDDEYWRLVGNRVPSRFIELMALPVRAWQRIMHWCDQFDDARNGNEELVKDLIDNACQAAKEAGFNEALMTAALEKAELGPNKFDCAMQRMREEVVRQLSMKSDVSPADSGNTHIEQGASDPDSNDVATRGVKTNAGQGVFDDARGYRWKTEGKAFKGGHDLQDRKGKSRAKKRFMEGIIPQKTKGEAAPPDTDTGRSGVDVVVLNMSALSLSPRQSPQSISSASSFHTALDIEDPSPSSSSTHQDSMSPPPPARSPFPTTRLQTVMEGPEGNGDETETGASTPRRRPIPVIPRQRPCQRGHPKGTLKDTMAAALPESASHQSQVTAIGGLTSSPGEEISTRSDRGSPGPDPELDASLTSADKHCSSDDSQSTATEKAVSKKKGKIERKKRNRKLSKETSAQPSESAPGLTSQAVPAPALASTKKPAKSKRGKKTVPAGSANAQAAPIGPATTSQGQASPGATPSSIVGRTQGGVPVRVASLKPQRHGFGSPATAQFVPGARPSRPYAATPAVGAVATGPGGIPFTSSATPSTTLGSGATTAPTPATTPSSQGNFKRVEKPKDNGPFWDMTVHSFECAMEGCIKECNLWDGHTVICPRCGPYSQVRYCGLDHMREDCKWHWTYCGLEEYTLKHWCVPSSLPSDVAAGPPLLPCLHKWDSPERQRQALWFSTGRREGDYFLFSDWNDQVKQGGIPGSLDTRCSPRVVQVVNFTDLEEKDRFRRILAVCLFAAVEHQALVVYLFRLIRDKVRAADRWNAHVDVILRQQFKYEMGFHLSPSVTGDRHACEVSWSGQTNRRCRDPVCAMERDPPLLGQQVGYGFKHLCSAMEADYWILRVNRTTHPSCQNIEDRMRGEGWGDDIAPQDRRAFRRGEGWDGAGSGPMEIESRL